MWCRCCDGCGATIDRHASFCESCYKAWVDENWGYEGSGGGLVCEEGNEDPYGGRSIHPSSESSVRQQEGCRRNGRKPNRLIVGRSGGV